MTQIADIIRKKRDGQELSGDEVREFVRMVANEEIQDSQIGAMLMAMYLRGLTDREMVALTTEMIRSGEVLQWDQHWSVVDKHSTGGVGDKVSLPLAPALAACGCKVPMISGRGLEYTGGTLDKLESIPGYSVQLSEAQMRAALDTAGCFIAGATATLAPADKQLYRVRDVTATVDSTPLIVGSILSKKIAEGTKSLAMDIKVGRAAFYKTLEEAKELAEKMIKISADLGLNTHAILSKMDTPIGKTVGNALEVEEAIECLKGNGPEDLVELITVLGGLLLQSCGKSKNLYEGREAISLVLNNGEALKHFEQMCVCHNVAAETARELCFGDITKVLPAADKVTVLRAPTSGHVVCVEALAVARVCWLLGAGRKRAGDAVDAAVGVRLLLAEGDEVSEGQPWCQVHHRGDQLDSSLKLELEGALRIGDAPPQKTSRILHVI